MLVENKQNKVICKISATSKDLTHATSSDSYMSLCNGIVRKYVEPEKVESDDNNVFFR